ncbi:MAG: hypothetical protein IJ841_01535 [Prevotella sp.]|nr:hypothetical protein [Prevotella sp.]
MRKHLLGLAVLLAIPTISPAQEKLSFTLPKNAGTKRTVSLKVTPSVSEQTIAKARKKASVVDGETNTYLIYARPEGAFYNASYLITQLYVPMWTDVTFDGVFAVNGERVVPTWGTYNNSNELVDNTSGVSEDGTSFTVQTFPFSNTYLQPVRIPSATVGENSFNLADDGFYFATYPREASIMVPDSLAQMSIWDPGTVIGYYDEQKTDPAFNPYFWFNGSGNKAAFGTAVVSNKGQNFYSYGFFQIMDKPLSPLYIESVSMRALNQGAKCMADGTELTLNFRKISYNEEGNFTLGDVIETFKCAAADVNEMVSGNYHVADLVFSKDSVDSFGATFKKPVVINERFVIEVLGFDQTGVNANVSAALLKDADDYFSGTEAYLYVKDAEGNEASPLSWGSLVPSIELNAAYDGIEVTAAVGSYENLNVLKPQEVENVGLVALSDAGYSVQLYTARPWNDAETGLENYHFEGVDITYGTDGSVKNEEVYYAPDWLMAQFSDEYRDFDTDEQGNVTDYGYGFEYGLIFCEPLPATIKGRCANLNIVGLGAVSDNPVIIIQGEVDDSVLGIDNPKAVVLRANRDGAIYDLNGKNVSGNFKGIVIKNGKKFFTK